MVQQAKPPLLSRERALEKMNAHHGGDPDKLTDIVRSAISFDTIEDLYGALGDYQTESDVVDVQDRIAKRTPMGYGDVRLYIRASSGQICTVRLLLGPIVEGKAGAHKLYEELLYGFALSDFHDSNSNDGGAVLAVDMFNYMDDDSVTLITGFPSLTDAHEYARRRTRDSVEEMRTIHEDEDNLRWLWLVCGEDCIALGLGTDEIWRGYSELESFLESPASATERDWIAFGQPFDLRAEPFAWAESE